MLFNSLHFLVFFPIVVALYFVLPQRWRWLFLLLASYYFYMAWKPEYALLILFSTVVDYLAALGMDRTDSKKKKKKFLLLSLFVNLGLLFVFKYFNFFSDSIRDVLHAFNIFYNTPTSKLLLPVGISFYTFQTLSYTIDVYRGKRRAEKHFGIFALYVSFFPQLVAGPIERSTHLLPQFFVKHKFDYDRVVDGLKLMLWGFFKKTVIADNAALFVDSVYGSPGDFTGLTLLLATYLFAFQIYCDFSGYSDIAIGVAKVMGYDLMDNFQRPYFSKSIREFWRRWHMSLSFWFRDYLYIPLGGSRVSKAKWQRNIFLVFLMTGVWHGASWTFVVWGVLQGLFILISSWTTSWRRRLRQAVGVEARPKLKKYLSVFITFHLVLFSWIFFRADSLADAWFILTHLFSSFSIVLPDYTAITRFMTLVVISSIIFMEIIHLIERHENMRSFLSKKSLWLRWGVYCFLLWMIVLFGNFGEQAFIYFQF